MGFDSKSETNPQSDKTSLGQDLRGLPSHIAESFCTAPPSDPREFTRYIAVGTLEIGITVASVLGLLKLNEVINRLLYQNEGNITPTHLVVASAIGISLVFALRKHITGSINQPLL